MRLEDVFVVDAGEAGGRLDKVLADRYESFSRSFIQKQIRLGRVTVNGKKVKTGHSLEPGEEVGLSFAEVPDGRPEPEDLPLDIVYEDSVIAVINKPPGMVVHPSIESRSRTIVNALLYRYPFVADADWENAARPCIVHRLDRNTSGLIIVALDARHAPALKAQFRDRKVGKQYRAIVHGCLRFDSDRIDAAIGRHPQHIDMMTVRGDGRAAVTEYFTMARYRKFTEIRVNILTGRTHQIRVHMAHIGHPVAADSVYGRAGRVSLADLGVREKGAGEEILIARQALHAERVQFTHPATNEPMEFQKDPPDDYRAFQTALKRYGNV